MSLDALRILSGNQELTSPIDNIPSPSSSAFNAQNLCLNNVMDTHPQLYKNTNSILNAPTAGPTIVNPKFFSINDEELEAAKKACEITLKCAPGNFKSRPLNSTALPSPPTSTSVSPAISVPPLPITKVDKGSCRVCGDSATGMYFGALVCVPCKTFFLRYAGENIGFRCKQERSCDIQTGNRTKCKYCRFQKCLFVGMTRRERPSQVHLVEGQQLCVVCLDLANGVHFGAVTCEGCKKFFRRGLTENPSYKCKSSKNCIVNPRTRNMCRFCRYQKCLGAGMSREAIQMGRPSKVRYTNDPIRPRPDHWNNESKVKRIKISNAVNASNNLISQSNNLQRAVFPNNSTAFNNVYNANTALARQFNVNTPSIVKIERRDSPESSEEMICKAEYGAASHCPTLNHCLDTNAMQTFTNFANRDFNLQRSQQNGYQGPNIFNNNVPPNLDVVHTYSVAFQQNHSLYHQHLKAQAPSPYSSNSMPSGTPSPAGSLIGIPQDIQFTGNIAGALGNGDNGMCIPIPAALGVQLNSLPLVNPELSLQGMQVVTPLRTCSSVLNGDASDSASPPNELLSQPIHRSTTPPTSMYPVATTTQAPSSTQLPPQAQIVSENYSEPSSGDSTPPLSDWSKSSLSRLVAEAEATSLAQEKLANAAVKKATDPGRIMAKQLQNTIEAKVANLDSKNQPMEPMVVTDLDLAGSIDENDAFTPDYWIRQLPDQNIFFTEQHRNIIEKAYGKFVENGAKINKTICSEFKEWKSNNLEISKYKIPPEFLRIKLVRHYTLSSVNYCESLPGFQDLNDADQYTILRYGQSQSRILVAAQKWYNPEENDFENFFPWKPQPPRPDSKFREDILKYSRIVRSLDLDAIEESLLNALVLISADYPGLKQKDIIEDKRSDILNAFTAFTTVKFGSPNDRIRVLFKHITPLREIGLFHHRMTFSMVVPD